MSNRLTVCAFVAGLLAAGTLRAAPAKEWPGFSRGMGLGGWLTNYKRFNVLPTDRRLQITEGDLEHFDSYISEADVARIASWGFDHVRLGFDQIVLEERPGVWRERTFRRIDAFADWCAKHRLNVVLNLHKAIGNYCDIPEKTQLLDDASLQDRFIALWLEMERRYHDRPGLAFELLNEVRDVDPEKWNALADRTIREIRRVNPDRWIVVGPVGWNNPPGLPRLKVWDDPRVVYTFHMYWPTEFTHQRGVLQEYQLAYNRVLDYPTTEVSRYGDYYRFWGWEDPFAGVKAIDRTQLEKYLAPAFDFVKAHPDKVLWNGEFGTIRHAPKAARVAYMRDVVSLCREHGIPWCVWNYLSTPNDGNRFSLVDDDTREFLSDELKAACLGEPADSKVAIRVGDAHAAIWHVAGGDDGFRTFVSELAGGATLKTYAHPHEVDFAGGGNDVYFLLPPKGALSFADWDVAGGERLRAAMDRGARVYLECCVTPDFAQDGLHADLNGFQTVGRPRYLHQEYVLSGQALLQARDLYYLPAHARGGTALARVSDCVGTHRESVKGTKSHPVLVRVRSGVLSAAMNLSSFDSRFCRPYAAWAKFFAKTFAPVTGRSEADVEAAFRKAWPEEIRLSHGRDAAAAVRSALAWHARSGVMPQADGTAGVFEMIRSNDLGVRQSYRGDTSLITAALFAQAGAKYANAEWTKIGRNLAEAAFARDIQDPRGYFRWYANGTSAYFSDCSRCARACLDLYRATGERRYREAAYGFADLVMAKTEGEHLFVGGPSGDVDLRTERPMWGGPAPQDNPCLYGDMVAFLCATGEKRYVTRAGEIVDRIMSRFPDVKPFGFSDNFTYARCLVMLAAAQAATDRDCSAKINFILDFMAKLATPCGAIAESPLRLADCHVEGGVAMGDGSDRIADILYCNSQVLSATAQLLKMPSDRRRTVDMAKVRALDKGLRRFFLDVQIASADPRLDGGWMRAFDTAQGEYYGLDKDMDWGAYCIMGGWVMGYVPMALMADPEE